MAEWLTYLLIGLFVAGWLACWYWGVALPLSRNLPGPLPDDVRLVRAGEPDDWGDEPPETWVEDLPPERPIVLARRPLAIALSDDPDLTVWDARQQWQRCWEIVHVEFPRLRAELGIAA